MYTSRRMVFHVIVFFLLLNLLHCTTTSLYTDCYNNLYAVLSSYLLILFSALSAFAVVGFLEGIRLCPNIAISKLLFIKRSILSLLSPSMHQHNQNRLKQDFNIQPDGPVVNIFQIQLHYILKILDLTPSADLPHSRDSWL